MDNFVHAVAMIHFFVTRHKLREQFTQIQAFSTLYKPTYYSFNSHLITTCQGVISLSVTGRNTDVQTRVTPSLPPHTQVAPSVIDEAGAGLRGYLHACAAGVEERAW